MASFERKPNGKIKAIIRMQVRDGGPKSKTFSSMPRAKLWAAQREAELSDIAEGQIPKHTLGEAFERYKVEVSPGKRGGRWEQIRLATLQRSFPSTALLSNTTPAQLALWRDQRLQEVSAGTVLRELGLLSAVFQRCVREWQWMRENPVKAIAKPTSPPHRDKLLTPREIRKVLQQTGRNTDSVSGRVGLAFLFALRTGMRAGEICGIRRVDVNVDRVTLPMTKNGTRRDVPLSRKANKVLSRALQLGNDPIFGLTTGSLDALFRRARDAAGLRGSGVVFHSTRHTAATWMASKVDVLTLCRIFGWRDPKMAMVYFNKTASDIAAELDK